MKREHLIFILVLSLATNNLFAQTNIPAKKYIVSLDAASQKDIDVIASYNMRDAVACPPEYANIISNTNLFTLAEQQLLNEARLSVTNHSGSGPTIRHVRNKGGDGYDLYDFGNPSSHQEYQFIQIKHGVRDGVYVEMLGDHCENWMRYSNGMAVDKWLIWNYDGSKLLLWANFKKPYNIQKFERRFP
jgi:hypothetical protein